MTDYKVKAPKKLIEVALPLKEINEACVREKSINRGHPSTLHLWWARRPLAAARAVLFAQLVNDPGWDDVLKIGFKEKADANLERERLFGIIRELVKWENINNELVLKLAREEIRKSWHVTCELNKDHPDATELFNPDKLPAFHDPFAGGGSIPLEAQRLGLEAWASDLNPVAVLINKAMIEIPPRFVGRRPTGPIPEHEKQLDTGQYTWEGVTGLAEDVRRYGHWIREEAYKRIGHFYPPIEVTQEIGSNRPDLAQYTGKRLTIIAYIWARTVKSSNPLFSHVDVPLASTFLLSDKIGKEAYIEPIINGDKYQFKVRVGTPNDIETVKKGTKAAGRTSNFYCLLSNTPIDGKYIKSEGQAGRIGTKLMAVVAEGKNCRVYLSPDEHQEMIAKSAVPTWKPDQYLVGKSADQLPLYGMKQYKDLFSDRQLLALNTFSELIREVKQLVSTAEGSLIGDIVESHLKRKNIGVTFWEAISLYLSYAIDKCTDYWTNVCSWHISKSLIRNTFGRQAIAMVWDYAEANPFSSSSGNLISMLDWVCQAIKKLPVQQQGIAVQSDAANQNISANKIVSTDPPYYDNIMYADLSDFFYVWQKQSLKSIFPDLFVTIASPKENEIVASPYRHKSKRDAEHFFLAGMKMAMSNISQQTHSAFPTTIYYAFKQSENSDSGSSSTGWETFLEAVIQSDFAIVGTWPMRTELANKVSGIGSNMLSSSIILVCRKRDSNSATISRKDFMRELSLAIPESLDTMINGSETSSPVAPVDLAQSAIGPGMAVYSKYKAILESDGSPMTVHTALILINKALDEYFKEREGDWDNDTRFCLQWFSEYGWKEGVYGEAEVLAKAKGLSVEGVRDSGVLVAGSGKVRLYRPSEYPSDWNPLKDDRTPVWEVLHQLIRAHQSSGESAAAEIASAVPQLAATARQLAFLLYSSCERQGCAEDARPYNDLVTAWLSIEKQAQDKGFKGEQIEAEF
jgi:putative DNA methylase